MRLSLNEIEVNLRKAALGAGLPYGLAVDAGRGGAWLAARGLPGIEDCIVALERVDVEGGGALKHRDGDEVSRTHGPVSAVLFGPMIADRLHASHSGGGADRIEAENVDSPLLCLAILAIAFQECRWPFALACGESPASHVMACGNDEGIRLCRELPAGPSSMTVILGADVSADALNEGPDLEMRRRESLETGVPVEAQLWSRVNHLAARILVPASEISRLAGAGAGTTDND